jgi:hypothetical protein
MTPEELAVRYTVAWCSQDPAQVASFFTAGGSLRINDGAAAAGRDAIAAVAAGFMSAFPDLAVHFDSLAPGPVYHWTLTGTHAVSGRQVRISGFEQWTLGADGLIEQSLGYFDAADYARQLGDSR